MGEFHRLMRYCFVLFLVCALCHGMDDATAEVQEVITPISVHEVSSFIDLPVRRTILSAYGENTIYFFDLDNTLVYRDGIGDHISDGRIVNLIGSIRRCGARVIGLTSRFTQIKLDGFDPVQPTLDMLKRLNLSFTESDGDYDFPAVEYNGVAYRSQPKLRRGCLFSDWGDKGDLMVAYLRQFNLSPTCIISFDDLWGNLYREAKSVITAGIPVCLILFRYIGVIKEMTDAEDFPHLLLHLFYRNKERCTNVP